MAISLLPYGIFKGVSDTESDCANPDGEGSASRLLVRCFFGGLVGLAALAPSFRPRFARGAARFALNEPVFGLDPTLVMSAISSPFRVVEALPVGVGAAASPSAF